MIQDASSLIAACPVCARGKPSCCLPAGLLHPLPVPLCPVNQTMEDMLQCVAASNSGSWSTYLPWVEYGTNSLVSAASGMSPFSASLGYQSPLFELQEVPSSLRVGELTALQEDLEEGTHRLSALFTTFPVTGRPLQGASSFLHCGSEGLAVHEGSSASGRGKEVGAALCGPL